MNSSEVLVGIGSNIGDRELYVKDAIEELRLICGHLSVSAFYETEPIGAADQVFLNGVVLCTTRLDPESFLLQIAEIEKKLGRKRKVKWGNRTIDLDILMWKPHGERSVRFESKNLKIPHPELLNRDFALYPCVELAPDWLIPDSECSIAEICAVKGYDLSRVRKDRKHFSLGVVE